MERLSQRELFQDYFHGNVEPLILATVRDCFPGEPEAALLLNVRFSSEARYFPSEILYWMLRDICSGEAGSKAPWGFQEEYAEVVPKLLVAVEFLNMGRLVRDDILDGHQRRQNFRALHLELDKTSAWLIGSGLSDAAMYILSLAGPNAKCCLDFVTAAQDYSRGLLAATFSELRFSVASRGDTRSGTNPLDEPITLTFPEYRGIMQRKHGIGGLCFGLSSALVRNCKSRGDAFAMFRQNEYEIARVLRDHDVAGGVDNDWSEFSGRRGRLGWDRIPHRRSKVSEIDLGRPTVWNVFLQDSQSLEGLARAGLLDVTRDLHEIAARRSERTVVDLVGELTRRMIVELLAPSAVLRQVMPLTSEYIDALRVRRTMSSRSDMRTQAAGGLATQPVLQDSDDARMAHIDTE